MARQFVLAFLLPLALAGCSADGVEARPFVDGERKLTDDGAFAVELWHLDGQPTLGENDFVLRVEFPDPTAPEAEGTGIPNAQIALDCWMPNAEHAMPVDPMIIPGAMGDYQLSHVELDEAGVWQFDFTIGVGDSVVETVSFAFFVE